ncbi:hypothetical protein Btru_031654 [Bulinus truncatus]|nr:hypothetical protein Btru_031654 [Bulinus truncatus]
MNNPQDTRVPTSDEVVSSIDMERVACSNPLKYSYIYRFVSCRRIMPQLCRDGFVWIKSCMPVSSVSDIGSRPASVSSANNVINNKSLSVDMTFKDSSRMTVSLERVTLPSDLSSSDNGHYTTDKSPEAGHIFFIRLDGSRSAF